MVRRKTAEERLGPVWNGSVSRHMLTSGKENCACHRDPKRRHGPYAYWTTKVNGKTVSRRLPPEEADLLTDWIQNRRSLEETKRKMVALSKKMAPLVLKCRTSTSG